MIKLGRFWTIRLSTALKTLDLNFELGREFVDLTCDGREVKTTVTQEGNALHVKQVAVKAGEKSVNMIFKFFTNGLVLKMRIDGANFECTQKFKRL